MAELVTSPTFIFRQGDVFENSYSPIQATFIKDRKGGIIIELDQDGRKIQFNNFEAIQAFFEELTTHNEAARFILL